jgi:hypothetical protein
MSGVWAFLLGDRCRSARTKAAVCRRTTKGHLEHGVRPGRRCLISVPQARRRDVLLRICGYVPYRIQTAQS